MMELNGTPQSQAAFINWLRRKQPRAYQILIAQSAPLGDWSDTISNVFSKITDTVTKLAPTYIETKAQYELLKLNIARAKQGMMPVDSLPGAVREADERGTTGGGFASGLPSWAIPAGIAAIVLLFLLRR